MLQIFTQIFNIILDTVIIQEYSFDYRYVLAYIFGLCMKQYDFRSLAAIDNVPRAHLHIFQNLIDIDIDGKFIRVTQHL